MKDAVKDTKLNQIKSDFIILDQKDYSDHAESMSCDVIIIGAGPAGLATAIQIKKIAREKNQQINVVVIEKAAEVGAHIISGAVIDPVGLDELIPDWKDKNHPLKTKVEKEIFYVMTKNKAWKIPHFLIPPVLKNHKCYITSLGKTCKWLAKHAEEFGVEIYTGFAATNVIVNKKGKVIGIITGDMGIDKNGNKKKNFQPGFKIFSKYLILAEGARGSITKKIIKEFQLDKKTQPQKFAIGIKEIWKVKKHLHQKGKIQHSIGWPLKANTGGGGFLYQYDEQIVAVGFVVHLNYKNPYISPFHEFQRYKTHPKIKEILAGGKRISYGARAITGGGYQSIPKLIFEGGALVGCCAGMVNLPRIKGTHNAILSGIIAAKAVCEAIGNFRHNDLLDEYQKNFNQSQIVTELKNARNAKPLWSKFGTWLGNILAGLDIWMRVLNIGLPFTLKHKMPDHLCTKKAELFQKIKYPKPDGVITFDITSSVFISNTTHEPDQPGHLILKEQNIPIKVNLPQYDEPAQRYCPAGVYEILEDQNKQKFLQINAQNCVHCKTCDIKDPTQNINWVPPEGGGGPIYNDM